MALLERQFQLIELDRLYRDCAAGRGAVAVVSGAVASGKTALLRAFADRVTAAGGTYLETGGSPAEQSLPYGVIGQLAHSAALPGNVAERLTGMLQQNVGRNGEPDDDVPPQFLAALCAAFLDLAAGTPLVIGVDDVLHADAASLTCLIYLTRRMRNAPVLLVVTVASRTRASCPQLAAEIFRESRSDRIRLAPLSRDAVTELLATRLGEERAHQLAPAGHAATGGNPLLVQALAEDNAATLPGEQAAELRTGEAFHQAVTDCLYRCPPDAVRCAHAMAVLTEPAHQALLGELTGTDAAAVAQSLEVITAVGLVEGGRFRHPQIRVAVLDSLAPEQRHRLHRESARLLRHAGAPAASIARHLVAVRDAAEPWAADVLQEAASQAVTEGRPEEAVECLRVAAQAGLDDAQSLRILTALVEAEWRIDPALAARHLVPLTAVLRDGRLPDQHARALSSFLVWHGRTDEAADVLRAETGFTADAFRQLLSFFGTPPAPARDRTGYPVTQAEQILQRCPLGDDTVLLLAGAVVALVDGERVDEAVQWCDRWTSEAQNRGAATWHALFLAVRGTIAIRQGEVRLAHRCAHSALTLLPGASWGVATGGLLALLLDIGTASGDHDTARAFLRQLGPRVTVDTPFGAGYLSARGRHQLATAQWHAALGDFQECGRLLARWGGDLPTLVPWRVDAGHALLRLGRVEEARTLAQDQLDRLSDRQQRARGSALRLLAATGETAARPALLHEAVHLLRSCGARLELAATLVDLGDAHQALGDSNRARVMIRHAWQVATECGAEALAQRLAPKLAGDDRAGVEIPAPRPSAALDSLSEAERRVAALAAQGHTNRYIARQLYITVSTVEQHLTRVYRKLNVNRRTDLLGGAALDLSEVG